MRPGCGSGHYAAEPVSLQLLLILRKQGISIKRGHLSCHRLQSTSRKQITRANHYAPANAIGCKAAAIATSRGRSNRCNRHSAAQIFPCQPTPSCFCIWARPICLQPIFAFVGVILCLFEPLPPLPSRNRRTRTSQKRLKKWIGRRNSDF